MKSTIPLANVSGLTNSCTADVAKEAGVVSHGRTLQTYSNICCRVFRMDTTVLAPTPSAWFSIDTLGGNSLFLGKNYPMMVKGDPAAVDTMLLPFMRSNCIYTLDIAMVPYLGTDIVGRFSLDDQSCIDLQINNGWPVPEITCGSKQAFPTSRNG